ncbi:hypothetical protein MMC07_009797, partial [Pseudocyphellaria aurata]|nr:hypothetical protein [Pseudocyphellaria aurata]
GHCLGDETVQCCHDQLKYTSTTYYNPDYNAGGQSGQTVQPIDEGNGRIGIIVPTNEGGGSSYTVEVPNDSANNQSGSISTSATSEEGTPFHYGKQSDNTFIVPTVSEANETPKTALGWRIIPNAST